MKQQPPRAATGAFDARLLLGDLRSGCAQQEDRGFNDQLKWGDGFGNEVISPAQHTLCAVLEVSMKRDKNDRCVLVMRNATQFLAHLDAVHARHVDVEENQVKDVVV